MKKTITKKWWFLICLTVACLIGLWLAGFGCYQWGLNEGRKNIHEIIAESSKMIEQTRDSFRVERDSLKVNHEEMEKLRKQLEQTTRGFNELSAELARVHNKEACEHHFVAGYNEGWREASEAGITDWFFAINNGYIPDKRWKYGKWEYFPTDVEKHETFNKYLEWYDKQGAR